MTDLTTDELTVLRYMELSVRRYLTENDPYLDAVNSLQKKKLLEWDGKPTPAGERALEEVEK